MNTMKNVKIFPEIGPPKHVDYYLEEIAAR